MITSTSRRAFLRAAQLKTGELPYDLDREHFMCYQYNSFEFLDVVGFRECETGVDVDDIASRLGANPAGHQPRNG